MVFASVEALLATLFVSVAAYGAGIWLPSIAPATLSKHDRIVSSWIGGFGALGVALFVVGQWSLSRAAIGTVLAIGLGLAVLRIVREPSLVWRNWRALVPARAGVPAAIVGIVLLFTAIGGLGEPIGDAGSDGVAYHWAGPKVWLRNDIVRPLPDNAPTAYPVASEMVFAALMEFGGDRAPAVVAAVTFALFLAMCALVARRCGLGIDGAWWVAALLAAMPAVYAGAYDGFIDAFYAAVVLAAARVAFDADRRRHFVAVGAFCGLAMSIKYPGLLVLPPLLVCALWPPRRAHFSALVASAAVAALTATVIAAPFYFKNWWFLGSPIYPPAPGWLKFLHVKYMDMSAAEGFYAYAARRGAGHGRSLWSLAALPFNLTYHTADFNGGGGIGLMPLALGPIGLVIAWPNAFVRRLAVFGALLTLVWFATMQDSRYLISVYAIAAILAVIGWEHAVRVLSARGRMLCALAVAVSMIYGLGVLARKRAKDMRAAISPAYAADRRLKEIPFIESLDFLNHDPSVTKVMLLDLWIPAYYSDREYIKPIGQYGERAVEGAATAWEAACRAPSLQVSHILDVHSIAADFQVAPGYPGLELVFERPDQRVYRVTSAFRCR